MIRDDIKLYLQENNLNIDDVFLQHRDTIDPPNYRVGRIFRDNTESIFVLNELNGIIMDYFYDDVPELLEFDISNSLVIKDGNIETEKYFINRDGKLKSMYTNKYLTIQSNELYPIYNIKLINSKNRLGHSKRLQIHRIIASVFVPNFDPKEKIFVDHINRNKNDYSIKNLRWVTSKENANNSPKKSFMKNRQYIAYKDKELTIEVNKFSDEDLLNHPRYNRGVILSSLYSSNHHYGLYWKIVDLNLLNYLSSIGKTFEDIDNSLWVNTRLPGVMAHPFGILKITTQKKSRNTTYITCGYERKYLTVNIQGTQYLVHRIIAEAFINKNKEIKFPYEVDHISTIPTDNRVENLKICTHLENVNNPSTKLKLSTSVIAEGKVFNSISECADYYKVARSTVVNWIRKGKDGFSFKN